MIDILTLEQYQNIANCRTDWEFSRESFMKISYQFRKGNVYGLVSDFGCGSWGLSTCIGGRGDGLGSGKIILNNEEIHCGDLSRYSGFITEKVISEVNSIDHLRSARGCIQNAIEISNQ